MNLQANSRLHFLISKMLKKGTLLVSLCVLIPPFQFSFLFFFEEPEHDSEQYRSTGPWRRNIDTITRQKKGPEQRNEWWPKSAIDRISGSGEWKNCRWLWTVPEFHVAFDLEQITGKSHVRFARGAFQHVTTVLWVPWRVDQQPARHSGLIVMM